MRLISERAKTELTGTGFYREATSIDPMEGESDFSGQGCIGDSTNWQLENCTTSGQAALPIGQVTESYRGVDGSTSDSCAFNPDLSLSFDVDPATTTGRPSGTTNLHGLTYQGPLVVSTSLGGQGLAIASMRSTTTGQVTCISSKETAGGAVLGVPILAGFTCGPVTEFGPDEGSGLTGAWLPGPVSPTLTDASKGQYSAKFNCYYGQQHEGTGSLDIEISTR